MKYADKMASGDIHIYIYDVGSSHMKSTSRCLDTGICLLLLM
jgi:hypothetical protein